MLSIGKLGKGQEIYYLEKVAEGAEDYYSGEGEAEGQWMGDAAAELGLSGEVEPDQLTAMLTGHNPATGEPLGLRPVPYPRSGPGLRSHLLRPQVGLPHLGARRPRGCRRGGGSPRQLSPSRPPLHATRGLLDPPGEPAATSSSKATATSPPPTCTAPRETAASQLHTHVLIANATKGPDGKWTRLYHPAIYDHAKTAGYLYEAHLRHELSRCLGIEWQEVRNGIAEIEGFKDEWLREFSTRRAEILDAAGPDASARARQVATLTTRQAKEQELTTETMRERWQAKAQEICLDREAIAATSGKEVELAGKLSIEQLDRGRGSYTRPRLSGDLTPSA